MTDLKKMAEVHAAQYEGFQAVVAYTAYLAGARAGIEAAAARLCQMHAANQDQRDFGNSALASIRSLLPPSSGSGG